MGGLFEAQFECDVLDRLASGQQVVGGDHPLLVQPILGTAAETFV